MLHGIVHAAIFDFTPVSGTVSAVYVPGSGQSGNVQLSISGQNQLSVPTGITQDISIHNGVVAWSSANTVYSYVFDAARNTWAGVSSAGSTFDLSVADGVVAWSTSAGAFFRVYDPLRKNWIQGSEGGAIQDARILNTNGVVAWSRSGGVFYYVYDPTRSGWQPGFTATGSPFDLITSGGVVAWSVNPNVYFTVYDPTRGSWRGQSESSGFTSELNIQNSQVTWVANAGNKFWGYNPASGAWARANPVPLACFAVSTNAGNAPFFVSFIDMSIGGSSWSLNFGDGSSPVSKRAHTHLYTALGRFTASQTVNNSTTNRVILTDITAPTGTIAINGGASFTTNRNVMLTLSATDNSGLVTSMRFSNEGMNWSDWESFSTSKLWPLNTNKGVRSVSAQFRDPSSNTSAVTSATILLDVSSLPIVNLVNTSVTEQNGSITLTATLEHPYAQPVAVNYTTSNGTAVAGMDYDAKSGLLTFQANVTTALFNLTIREDSLAELDETILIHFSVISNAVPGVPGVVTIIDNDDSSVSFAQTNYNTIESNTAVIVLRLSSPTSKTVTVDYAATNGTATAELDYIPTFGRLTFPPGATNASFTVQLIDDSLDEFPETIALKLITATNAVLVAPTNATLTIIDDDNPLVFFSSTNYVVAENTGFAEIHVWLSKPFSKPAKVRYTTSGGTAIPGLGNDYLAVSADLEFSTDPSSADSTNQFFFVNLVNDSVVEPIKTIHLRLSNLRDAGPGFPTEADIFLIDDDGPPKPPDLSQPILNANGLMQFTLLGIPGQRFDIEYSVSLPIWLLLERVTNTTGLHHYTQPILTNAEPRFFRTKLVP